MIAMTPTLATIAQAHGATLVGLGLIDWLARDADKRGLIAVLAGNQRTQARYNCAFKRARYNCAFKRARQTAPSRLRRRLDGMPIDSLKREKGT